MSAWYGDDNDDGIDPFDVDELYDEVDSCINTAIDATGDSSIDIEINIVDKYEFELGLISDGHSHLWESDIDAIKSAIVARYPDADWEDSGWK